MGPCKTALSAPVNTSRGSLFIEPKPPPGLRRADAATFSGDDGRQPRRARDAFSKPVIVAADGCELVCDIPRDIAVVS
jgi:hypothetical protein